ncbi:hypothetical protein FH972_021292 [Carpinus fangiana]|uniref:ENTH domain-containing protein n=1 Tax=Carpinus fangiana TaxID=176857 RepID=A0A5N6KNY3_9ROSI|nr:hypothetical protein FH972_021292 [Carpinus fangiana]
MSSSFEKSVKGATKVKLAPPKSKYIEHILQATHSGENGVGEVFRTLQFRLRDSTWTIAFKALLVVHLMIRDGEPNITLKYLSQQTPSKVLAVNTYTDVQTQGRNIRSYSRYLVERAKAYAKTRWDYVGAAPGRLKRLPVEKGLLRETESVQDQIQACLRCGDFFADEPENEISLTAFRTLTMDLLALFAAMNEGTIAILEHYFEMSKPDAERALEIYKTFASQTDKVVRFLQLARQYENVTRLEIPKIKHAPTNLINSLEEYLHDKDFETNRRQYLAQQEGFNPFQQQAGFTGQQNGFAPQAQFQPQQQTGFAPQQQFAPQPTGLGFGGYTPQEQQPPMPQQQQQPQPNYAAFASGVQQQIPQQQLIPQATGSNPFRQSMMPQPTNQTNSPFGGAPLMRQSIRIVPVAEAAMVLSKEPFGTNQPRHHARQNDPTDYCKKWSQQSALVNGTLYLYGGRAITDPSQTSDEWSPPAVANGYMWSSYSSLYLYGGEYSDNPVATPDPFALWEFKIGPMSWRSLKSPTTSGGTNAAEPNDAVQPAAEGAGLSVASLGRGWYFGGHQDGYTTNGWSQSVTRVYLKSLLEFTFPGYINTAVDALSDGQAAGSDGAWRNVTGGGVQESSGFPERADGVLVYVPGFGDQGIVLGLAGGTNNTFTQMNSIDVYDVANSMWYRQSTSGEVPAMRVNPCAVVAAAPDGSSYNIYMWGGQNLQPAGEQIQYDDMWILSVPSFTWISVGNSTPSGVLGRSGHTCNIWDGQMVVVGGYVGNSVSCDSPGVYVYDLSTLAWVNSFTSRSSVHDNPQNKQESQADDPNALSGSYGYQVPEAVQSVIGGSGSGGATIITPVATATAGPIATGAAATYTTTSTSTNAPGSNNSGSANNLSGDLSTSNAGSIAAGVIAGVAGIAAIYLGFCAWLYRKRLRQHQRWLSYAHQSVVREANRDTGALAYSGRGKEWPGYTSVASPQTESQRLTPYGSSSASQEREREVSPGDFERRGMARTAKSSTEDLIAGQEPSFMGIMLHPRRSLRETKIGPSGCFSKLRPRPSRANGTSRLPHMCYINLCCPAVDFLPHTYLVGIRAIKKALDLSEHPVLHITVVCWYESPSGASSAQFLLAFTLDAKTILSLLAWPAGRATKKDRSIT